MKKLVLEGKSVLRLIDTKPPVPRKGEEIVTVELAGIGGSEYLAFKNPGIRNLPNAMGHGIVGTTDSGRRVAINPLLSCGQCENCNSELPQLCEKWKMIGVHCDGGFSQQLTIASNALITLPDSLSWQKASFIEPFANSINAVELSAANEDSSVAVVGAGSLGLGVIAACSGLGCRKIVVFEPSKSRSLAAKYLGATKVEKTSAMSYDLVFDTVGTEVSRQVAVNITRSRGTCILMGFAEAGIELDCRSFIRSQKQMIGAFAYSTNQFRRAVTLAEKIREDWVTNLQFVDVQGQLEDFLAGDFSTIKAVLRPNL